MLENALGAVLITRVFIEPAMVWEPATNRLAPLHAGCSAEECRIILGARLPGGAVGDIVVEFKHDGRSYRCSLDQFRSYTGTIHGGGEP